MNRTLRNVVTILVLAAMMAYFLLPIWWVVVSSTKDMQTIFGSNPLWFAKPTLNDYALAFSQTPILRWLLNSVIISVFAGVIGAVVSAMAGYSIGKFRFRGRDVLSLIIAVAVMVPSTAIAFPTFVLEQQLGLVNTYQAVILPSAVSAFGAYFMIIYAQESVPKEVLDAARLDGASEFRVFWSVAMRFFKPALMTLFIIIFTATWNNFLLPLFVLRDQTLYMIPQGLTTYVALGSGFVNIEYAILLAGSVISILPIIVLFLSLEKYIESGLGLGAVRG